MLFLNKARFAPQERGCPCGRNKVWMDNLVCFCGENQRDVLKLGINREVSFSFKWFIAPKMVSCHCCDKGST